jgi:cell wall-associated NlpC family hydrolase
VARALDLVGTPFRPQGRRREHGLDCLGLVALAANLPLDLVPADYTLREIVSAERFAIDFEGRVTRIDPSEARPGDVLLVLAAARQNHFLVLVPGGFVHANARLGRVVETPGQVPCPVLAAWRREETD